MEQESLAQKVQNFEFNKSEVLEKTAKVSSEKARKEVSLLHFITGAIAGAVSRTATWPLERIKIY